MAVRKAYIYDLPTEGQERKLLGQLIDDGVSEPYGTTPSIDQMVQADRRDRFERYYLGYSNGYTFQSLPDVAESQPRVWQQFLAWARTEGRGVDQAGKVAKLSEMAKAA